MGYAFVQQVASAGTTTAVTNITNPSATVTAGSLLLLAAITSSTNQALLTITGTSDTWNYAGACNNGTGQAVALYYAMNAAGGATAPIVTSPGTDMYSTCLWEYSGIATSGALVATGASSNNQLGGTVGADVIASGSVAASAVPGMLFSFCYDFSAVGHAPPSAGTSPLAFTGRTPVWAGNNSGGSLPTLTAEDIRITSAGSYAPTFGTTATNNNSYDNFGVLSAFFAEPGAISAALAVSSLSAMGLGPG